MKKCIAVLSLLWVTTVLFAKNVSIQVVQNNPAVQEKVCASSSLIEQTIIDYFFGFGHIVSNSPIYVVSKDSGDDGLTTALKENAEGGMDYLVRIEVDYKSPTNLLNPDVVVLENIEKVTWKNYSLPAGAQFASGSEKITTVNRKDNNEDGVASFATLIAAKINASLKENK